MNKGFLALSLTAALAASAPALGQANRGAEGLRMPYQGRFWGYAGLNIGRSSYDIDCSGFTCDKNGDSAKLYAGGRFNDWLGLEVGYVDLGKADFAGGKIQARGLNLSLVGAIPVGQNSSVFGKVGTTAGHTDISGTAAGPANGTENGWGLSYGVGGQIGLTPNWALRLDADRYRFKFAGDIHKDVDAFTVGAQYTFR